MRTLWPPINDEFTARIWSLVVALTFLGVLVLWAVSGVGSDFFWRLLTAPGSYAALWFANFEPERYTTASWVAWFLVNFFCYFVITRLVIGSSKLSAI